MLCLRSCQQDKYRDLEILIVRFKDNQQFICNTEIRRYISSRLSSILYFYLYTCMQVPDTCIIYFSLLRIYVYVYVGNICASTSTSTLLPVSKTLQRKGFLSFRTERRSKFYDFLNVHVCCCKNYPITFFIPHRFSLVSVVISLKRAIFFAPFLQYI